MKKKEFTRWIRYIIFLIKISPRTIRRFFMTKKLHLLINGIPVDKCPHLKVADADEAERLLEEYASNENVEAAIIIESNRTTTIWERRKDGEPRFQMVAQRDLW